MFKRLQEDPGMVVFRYVPVKTSEAAPQTRQVARSRLLLSPGFVERAIRLAEAQRCWMLVSRCWLSIMRLSGAPSLPFE